MQKMYLVFSRSHSGRAWELLNAFRTQKAARACVRNDSFIDAEYGEKWHYIILRVELPK